MGSKDFFFRNTAKYNQAQLREDSQSAVPLVMAPTVRMFDQECLDEMRKQI